MSQFLRDCREKLRAAVIDLDARLAEIQIVKAEEAELFETRRQLLVLIDGPSPYDVTTASEGRATSPAPTHAQTTVKPGERLMDARRRIEDEAEALPSKAARAILVVLSTTREPVTLQQLVAGCRLKKHQLKYTISRLVDTGEIVRTGRTHSTRYSLPTGRAKRAAGNGNGKGSPADDDAHGAVRMVASAGDPGVTSAPGADTICQQPVLRPPASREADMQDLDHEPSDVLAGDVDHEVFDEPPYRAVVTRPELRQAGPLRPASRTAAAPKKARESWWLRPDADYTTEAERMRLDSKAMNVPGQNNILCMDYGRAKGGDAW